MYVVNTDSSIEPFNPGGILSWAFIVKSLAGKEKGEVYRDAQIAARGPDTTNNQGEYLAVMAAILWFLKMPEEKRRPIIIQSDSQLVVNQCSGKWQCKDEKLSQLHDLILKGINKFGKSVTFKWIPRENNLAADELSRSVYANRDIQLELKELRENQLAKDFGDDDLTW